MPETFAPGAIAKLISGGPAMTVVRVEENGFVRCTWFDVHQQLQNDYFSPATITIASQAVERLGATGHRF